jgi:hypothetical protein
MTNFSPSENVRGGATGSACGRFALVPSVSDMRSSFRAVAPTGRAADSKSACCGFESLLPCESVNEHGIKQAANEAADEPSTSGYGN